MSNVVPFRYRDAEVRVVNIDGEPWWVLADLCRALDLTRGPSQVAERLDDEVRQAYPMPDALGRMQQTVLVSEPGMYEVVLRSDKEEARDFRRWVTHEVLPTIRRTGSYGTAPALPQTYAEALRELASTVEAKAAVEAERDALAPRAGAWDHLASTSTDYSVQQAATILARDPSITIGQRRLFAWMDNHNWTYRCDGHRAAYQRRIESGHLAHRLIHHIHPRTGEVVVDAPQVRVTVKGLTELHRVLGGSAPLSVQPMLEVVA